MTRRHRRRRRRRRSPFSDTRRRFSDTRRRAPTRSPTPSQSTNCFPMMVPPGTSNFGSCDSCPERPSFHFQPSGGLTNPAYSGWPIDVSTGCMACPAGRWPVKYINFEWDYGSKSTSGGTVTQPRDEHGNLVQHFGLCGTESVAVQKVLCSPPMSDNYLAQDMVCIKNVLQTSLIYAAGIKNANGQEVVPVRRRGNADYYGKWDVRCRLYKITKCTKGGNGARECKSTKKVSFEDATPYKHRRRSGKYDVKITNRNQLHDELKYLYDRDELCSQIASLA